MGKVLCQIVWRYKNEQDRKHNQIEEIRCVQISIVQDSVMKALREG